MLEKDTRTFNERNDKTKKLKNKWVNKLRSIRKDGIKYSVKTVSIYCVCTLKDKW